VIYNLAGTREKNNLELAVSQPQEMIDQSFENIYSTEIFSRPLSEYRVSNYLLRSYQIEKEGITIDGY
jgi:hypothetical protein